MSTSLSKRPAGDSPDGRPSKRLMSSSPEEGELDDSEPPPPPAERTPPLPSSAAASKAPSKVPFPFKKKAPATNGGGHLDGPPPPRDLYGRPNEYERRYRDDDPWRNGRGPPPREDGRVPWAGDHWVAGQDPRGPPPSRPPFSRRDLYDVRYISDDRDRSYRPMNGANNSWEPPRRTHTLVSPPRRARSPSSPRSRSPSSPGSPGRGIHRLPRSTVADLDTKGEYEGGKGEFTQERWRDTSPNGNGIADEDRHYRPRDTWSRREQGPDSLRREERGRGSRTGEDVYAPTSPRPPSPQSLNGRGRTSPPPRSDDAPPSTQDEDRPTFLPNTHTAVKISLPKKPPTPRERSPRGSILAGTDGRKQEVDITRHRSETAQPARPPLKPRRKPVQRSREEEMVAYNRVFQGCGQQSDYEVTTKLGEGTFGEVHKALHKAKGTPVALKRILMHNEKEGMPITALREIKILKALQHPCIIDIFDMFVVRSRGKETPLSVYMVFPYMDHDLAGLLENERVKLTPSQIKLYMKQLLEGTEYMHRNHILHRDMKAANLLISNSGSLKIADFGLARAFDPSIVRNAESKDGYPVKERKYTNCVVTRWYRPPELLLGARQYGGEVDMWGVGCVLGEMFARKPILPGSSDLDQLEKIWHLCGTPTQITWPNFDTLPGCEGVKRFTLHPRRVKQTYETIGLETCDLLDKLLTCNPRERITATQALDHDYFWTDPLPAALGSLPPYEASHEFDKRGRRQAAMPPVPHRPEPQSRPYPAPTQPHPHYGRPPPPRESYRNGPPLHHHSRGPPPPPPPYIQPLPATLPPLVLRPGQPLPPMYQQPISFPPHLPARPSSPVRGGGGGDRGYRAPRAPREEGSGLNYG